MIILNKINCYGKLIKMKKVLFLAFFYNHTNEVASNRLQGIAKYLPEYSWEPIIVAPKTSNPTVHIGDIKVVETDYEDMVSKFMPKSKGKENKTEFSGNTPQNNLVSKAISLAGEVFAYPDGMKYWYKPAVKEASKIIESEEIDGIISSSFPITAHKVAYTLKEKYNIPWIADLRDLWNLNPYVNHTRIRNYFEKRLELKLFAKADALTTTTPLAKEKLATLHPNKKIVPIVSGFDNDDFKGLKQTQTTDKLTLMYAGSLYNGKRDPSILFEALNQLNNENKIDINNISINFYGDSGNINELSEKYNIEPAVHVNGKISHEEVLQNQMNSDVLLLVSWMNENETMFIPGKVYEYMGSKKPIYSIGYKEGSLKDLIEKTNVGYHVSTVEDAKKAIYDYYLKYYNNELKYSGNKFAEEYSMENTAKNFAKLLEEIQ